MGANSQAAHGALAALAGALAGHDIHGNALPGAHGLGALGAAGAAGAHALAGLGALGAAGAAGALGHNGAALGGAGVGGALGAALAAAGLLGPDGKPRDPRVGTISLKDAVGLGHEHMSIQPPDPIYGAYYTTTAMSAGQIDHFYKPKPLIPNLLPNDPAYDAD